MRAIVIVLIGSNLFFEYYFSIREVNKKKADGWPHLCCTADISAHISAGSVDERAAWEKAGSAFMRL